MMNKMNKNTINLLSGTILAFSIVLSGACKKVEVVDEKIGGCYDTDSPMHNGSIDYDDGSCQYAYIDMYELTRHPDQDPANSGQDWDLIAVGDATRPDVLLTITNQLTGEVLFESPEIGDIAPNSSPSWSAPYQEQLFNHNYEWTLYDNDLSGSELMAAGVFNPIELANNGAIRTGVVNPLGDSTVLTLFYTLK
jgi:hypothetical protein